MRTNGICEDDMDWRRIQPTCWSEINAREPDVIGGRRELLAEA